MNRPAHVHFVFAALAALVLAFLPSCAMYRADAGPIGRPHIVKRVAPRDAEAPRIERSAGEFVPNDGPFQWSYLVGGLLFALIMFVVGYLIKDLDHLWHDLESSDSASPDQTLVQDTHQPAPRSP